MTPRISWKMIKKKNARQCIRWPEKGSLLAASLFKTIFVPLIFHREKNETAIEFNDLNRHEPLLPALEFNNAFSKKRKKKKKRRKKHWKQFQRVRKREGYLNRASHARLSVTSVKRLHRNETLLHAQRGSNMGVEKNPVWLTRLLSRGLVTCLSSRVNYYRLTRMENERAKGREMRRRRGIVAFFERKRKERKRKEGEREKKEETYKNPCPRSNSSSGTTSGRSRFPEKYLLAC